MTDTQTERGSCKFTVQEVEGGKQAIVVQTGWVRNWIGRLRNLLGTPSYRSRR
jgi:hypothetical protein